MDSIYIFLVLLVSQTYFPASADRKFGCLFENELCSPYEICVNDGMFGRCHSKPVPGTEVYTYDVSLSVVQHFRTLLQKLSHRGLIWEDEATQQILSKELSKLRKIPYRHLQDSSPHVYSSSKSRPSTQAMDPGDQKIKPVEVELSRNLQNVLQHLGLLSQASSPTGPKSPSKSDLYQSGVFSDYYRPKSQGEGHFPPLSLFQPPYQDRHSAGDGDLLVAALRHYLSAQGPPQTGGGPKVPTLPSPLRPSYSNSIDSAGPKENSQSQTPNVDRLLLIQTAGASQPSSPKEPFSPMDEVFIQKVLKNVGRHNVDVDDMSPKDMDQLSTLIANALQVVDKKHPQARPGPRDLGEEEEQEDEEGNEGPGEQGPGEQEEEEEKEDSDPPSATEKTAPESTLLEESVVQERQMEGDREPAGSNDKPQDAAGLFAKLLAYLDKSESPAQRLRGDSPGQAGVAAGLGKGRDVGLENVRSKTTLAEAAVQKKSTHSMDVEEVAAVEGWIQAVEPPAAKMVYQEPLKKKVNVQEPFKKKVNVQELQLDVKAAVATKKTTDDDYGYVITDTVALQTDEGLHLMEILARRAKLQMTDFLELSVVGPAVTFRVRPNTQNVSTADVANVAVRQKDAVEKEAKVIILEAGITDRSQISQIPTKYSAAESAKFLILTVVSILCIVAVLLASIVVYCLRHHSYLKLKEKLTSLGTDTGSDATSTYQEPCRQRMSVKPPAECPEPMHSVAPQFSDGGPIVSPSARSSTSSWSEEPVHSNMDISTGHMILFYMEDHLKNQNRLEKEWEALCGYQAEPNASTTGLGAGNTKKNRSNAVVAYDHSRITLKVENSQGNSDYINASPVMDHDPRNPAYIATQGPLPSTVSDFWQMVWENGCVVIVMLTPLTESGVKQCYHYWPDEGSNLYHIYEVNLVSEHIWCDDFLVRSFYLKNMQTNETRTVTQFHFLTWLNQNVPESSRTLLDFRRKVNKCYRGRSCPIIVHCSDGAGRSGTYILIDMVLNKMAKGAKEIDIAATLEHLRDQRPAMVQTKGQFEFALTAVAEEVNAILKALPQ
ncbi:receptor-type tyrosine-protein phosphatase N2-like isoform X2 [Oncorhynchus keta]|uniref:receptor-type tyrosine-protein phosphatase N2-like isoform X2 n=1 Tax=Oncorhynchus keta TaxID=8018 RepID=UPI00227D3F62|nr:receptor-type tyrosine-protein phosphatase N2-like isoform X2 [Oncorhynchus keta]